jgi:apolipoprotein D and lipocalin family protein
MKSSAVALFALAVAACSQSGPEVEKDFDLARFQGRWYEIASVPRDYTAYCHDTVADYRRTTTGELDLRHTCALNSAAGEKHEFRAVARVDDPSVPAKMAMQIGSYTGAYWVLDVNERYDYALVGHPARTMLWVLSRTPALDPATYDGALQLAEKQGFNTGLLRKTPQSAATTK